MVKTPSGFKDWRGLESVIPKVVEMIFWFFFNEKLDIEHDTSLSPYRQDKAVKMLVDIGVLETEIKKNIPPKRFYKVNVKKINTLLLELYS